MKKNMIIFILFFTFINNVYAKHIHKEVEYQHAYCSANSGIEEYKLPDKTRVDCLTEKYAIEFDFHNKWAESIGQALYYAEITGNIITRSAIIELLIKEYRL